ncbi:TcmI family type II polyketide cyclase [Streptomyces sp. NPDC005017]|uniref:TcmI family type II polyketide cyclase n=1 Tax=Streptomyces sp. NPDC005017 TaxID=3364706 RepID=UPI0036B45BBF
MRTNLIVARMDPEASARAARVAAEFDSTDLPRRMGTLRRELFMYKGLYFHVQQFDESQGSEAFERAWTDPRFVRARGEAEPYFEHYDPQNWRSIRDSMATCFYHWEAPR